MISRDNATPLAEQVAEDIRERVRDGEYEVGAKLPPLRELRETYGVAEVTVHNAIRELQREGVLVSSTGRGTYVNALPESGRTSCVTGSGATSQACRAALSGWRSSLVVPIRPLFDMPLVSRDQPFLTMNRLCTRSALRRFVA